MKGKGWYLFIHEKVPIYILSIYSMNLGKNSLSEERPNVMTNIEYYLILFRLLNLLFA